MIPRHLAIVPDGNRRLAKRIMEKPWKGHEWGIEKLYKVLDWCREAGIRTVTVYALSLENITKRPKEELDFIYLLMRRQMENILTNPDNPVNKNKVKMIFFGKLDALPKSLQDGISKVMEKTRKYKENTANFAIAYGGRQELVRAFNSIARKLSRGEISTVDEKAIKENLYTNGFGDPDLVIRTGGEKRLSNFLPFQTVYSELAFTDTFWPELTKKEFLSIIEDFSSRNRRFGS